MNPPQHTILLAEEDPQYILLVKRAVERANSSTAVQVVKDMTGAIRYLKGQDFYADRKYYPLPTVIVTNINLPKRPGLELLAWVRRQPTLQFLPVVVLSSFGKEDESEQVKNLLGTYFVKSLPVNELVDTLKDILSHLTMLQEWKTLDWR